MNAVNFNNSLSKAQQLMLDPAFNQMVEAKSSRARKSGNMGGNDLAALEAQAFGYTSQPQQSYQQVQPQMQYQYQQPQYQPQQMGSMIPNNGNIQMIPQIKPQTNNGQGLPAAIAESFKKIPPQTGDDYSGLNSMLNQIVPPQGQPQMLYEQQLQPQQNFDLKAMIKEVVKEVMNESGVVKGMRIANGNKIQFVDTKGNLYEGTLSIKKKADK